MKKIIMDSFTDETDYREVEDLFDEHNIAYRSYCAVD
jgi:hypothetical protein